MRQLVCRRRVDRFLRSFVVEPFPYGGFMIDPKDLHGVRILHFKKKFAKTDLQKFLVSKILYDLPNFELKDLAAMFFNQIELEEQFRKGKDKSIEEWREDLSTLSKLLKEFNFSNNLSDRGVINFAKRLASQKFTKLVVQKRNYQDWKKKIDDSFEFVEVKNPIPKKPKEEPKAYIGKGYTDKGNAKNPATHGSPKWQDVASSDKVYPIPGEKEYDKRRKEINQISEAIKILKRDLREIRIRRRNQNKGEALPC